MFAVQEGIVVVEFWEGDNKVFNVLGRNDVLVVPSMIWHRFRVLRTGRMVEVYWADQGGEVNKDDIIREDVGGLDDLEKLKEEILRACPDHPLV
jgi:hypothetical protein